MCEMPPPEKKEVPIGTCPVEWGTDGGTDALESGTDANPDG
jgi:hypothetical protein